MSDIIIGRRNGNTYFIREEGTPNGLYESGEGLYVRNASGRVRGVPEERELQTLRRLGIVWLHPGNRLGGLARYTASLQSATAALRRGDLARIPETLRNAYEAARDTNIVPDRERMRRIFQTGHQRVSHELRRLTARFGIEAFMATSHSAGERHNRWFAINRIRYDYASLLHDVPYLGSSLPLRDEVGMW